MLDVSLLENYNKTRPFAADKICYAPFTSLYFGHAGKVTACCENREHLLGIYPQQSIREIWNGTPALQLRKYISEQNLWHGCKSCDFDLRSGNYEGVKARIFDAARMNQKNEELPAMLEFELENTCNLECIMCTGTFSSSIRKNREHLPPISSPYDKNFVEQLGEFIPHLSVANFFGGEPFLVELYYEIWEKIASLNPDTRIWVTTNCTILNNRVKDLLGRLKFNLTCSIDALDKETYEKVRVNANYERVIANLEYFIQYAKLAGTDFTLNTCPMPANWKSLPDIIAWANQKGVVVNIIPVRFPEHMSLRSLPVDSLRRIIEYYNACQLNANDAVSSRNKKGYNDFVYFVQQWLRYKEQTEVNGNLPDERTPLALIESRIAASLHFTSASELSRQERVALAMKKITNIQQRIENIHPELGNAIWRMALQSNMEEMLFALFTWSEDEIFAQAKAGIGLIVDSMTDSDSEKTHFTRLQIAADYFLDAGVEKDSMEQSLLRWKEYLRRKKNDAAPCETIFQAINSHPIMQFTEALLEGEELALLQQWQTTASV